MSQKPHLQKNSRSNVQRPVTFEESVPNNLSRSSSRDVNPGTEGLKKSSNSLGRLPDPGDFGDYDSDDMEDRRPPLHRPTDGRSHQPLLRGQDEERGRTGYSGSPERPPMFSRRSTMRSRSPDTQAKLATKKKYTYAAFFLGLSLISFTVQTETAVYIQHELGWNKAYCMLLVLVSLSA
jgi:hypothetical protein